MDPNKDNKDHRVVYIDNLEKGVTKEVLYNFFKKFNIRSLLLNRTSKIAKVEFQTEANARDALLATNCKPILKRPIRMSLKSENATLTEFHLLGLEKVDLNELYNIAEKFGKSCRLGFNVSERNKVLNRGYLSYTEFPKDETERLKALLQEKGVTCQPYQKTTKSTVKVENFTEPFNKADLPAKIIEFTQLFKKQLKELCNFEDTDFNVGIVAVPKADDINEVFASITFDAVNKAAQFYEEFNAVAKEVLKRQPTISIRVSEEKETLTNLVTFGLKKEPKQPEN